MGLGVHGGGLGSAHFFAARGARVIVTDTKSERELRPSLRKLKRFKNISYVLGRHRKSDFSRADLIIKNPAVRKNSPYLAIAKKHGVPIETDTSLFFRLCKNPIIGVTGTKGKSTVTNLLRIALGTRYRVRTGGNTGVSVLAILPKLKTGDIALLELSSWQLEGMAHVRKSPHIAVITNIQHDHLNTYKNFREYASAKKLIYAYQHKNDWLVIPPELNHLSKSASGKVVIFAHNAEFLAKLRNAGFPLPGSHNIHNALLTREVARIMGVPEKKVLSALSRIEPLFGRYETVAVKSGVAWINDTCSTAPYSTIQSIRATKKPLVLITGGTDKSLPYKDLAAEINKKKPVLILLSGSATEKLKQNLRIPYQEVKSLKEAVRTAAERAKKGGVVLFSPAAASFELFKNEFDRGRKFAACVRRLRIGKEIKEMLWVMRIKKTRIEPVST